MTRVPGVHLDRAIISNPASDGADLRLHPEALKKGKYLNLRVRSEVVGINEIERELNSRSLRAPVMV